MINSESIRRLRIPGYLVMAATTIVQLVDVGILAWPFRVHSAAWRLGVIRLAANAVGTPMLAFLVILGIAVVVGDKGVTYVVSSLAGFAGVLCLLAIGVFALDALEMKGTIQASLSHEYDLVSYWLVIRVLIAALVFIVISVSALRVGKTVRRDAARPTVKGGSRLVVGSSRPGSPSPVGPHRGVGADRS